MTIFLFSIAIGLLLLGLSVFYCFYFSFFNFFYSSLSNLSFLFCLDYVSLVYLFMVGMVTFLVLSYSILYLEHYNNKKFFFLTFFFFMSMVLLVMSNSLLGMSMGWDGLGISSVLLIIFYPNKTSVFNSLLTMYFNRLGDVFVVCLFFFCILNLNSFSFLSFTDSCLLVFLIVVCSFSKSAQLPLSSWLPAAMSAPTPISAMVHSSTLVTAGIYALCSFLFYLSSVLSLLYFFSVATFLLGGLFASIEYDYKKTIAFSTMSQISMIIIFLFSSFFFLSLSHMIFHAFFKTLLFVGSGFIFSSLFTSQSSPNFYGRFSVNFVYLLLFVSLYMMSGFYFSSSFYSKDLVLEFFLASFNFYNFFIFITGSFFTIFYCCKLSNVFFFSPIYSFLSFSKNLLFLPLFIFFFIVMFSGFLFNFFVMSDLLPLLSFLDSIFISFFLMFCLTFSEYNSPKFVILNSSVFFTKFFFYSIFSKGLNYDNLSTLVLNDFFFFKKFYLVGIFPKTPIPKIGVYLFIFFLSLSFIFLLF